MTEGEDQSNKFWFFTKTTIAAVFRYTKFNYGGSKENPVNHCKATKFGFTKTTIAT
jgi:hypothetical protein